MSCFGVVAAETSAIGGGGHGGSRRPWRWWRAKCAGIAAAVGSRIRKSIRKGIDGRRRHHHRRSQSFAPVYADELYSHHHHPPKPLLRVVLHDHDAPAPTTTSGDAKPPAVALPPPVVAHAAAPVARAAARATVIGKGAADASRGGVPARAGGAAVAAAGVGAAMRNVLLRSPGRGGGGVLGAVKGMGEVDLRAELFIRKFKEDMRLQGQRSAEEFQAMLARGL